MTTQADYLEQLTPDNAAVLFIDSQTTLALGVQSINTTLLKTNTEGLAKVAKMFDLPVILTTTGGGAGGASGGLPKGITETFPNVEPVNRMGNLNAMDVPRFAAEYDGRTGSASARLWRAGLNEAMLGELALRGVGSKLQGAQER